MDPIVLLQGVPFLGPYLPVILALAGLCAAISALLPPPKQLTGVYAIVYTVVNWIGINLGHARNASAPSSTPKPPPLMVLIVGCWLLGIVALAACSLTPEQQQKVAVVCKVDGGLVPIAQPIVATLGTVGASVATTDALLVHPLVVKACAALNGTPASVTPTG